MKTIKSIKDKEIAKRVNNMPYYDVETFAEDCRRYAKALKDGRLIASVKSVSRSGMRRVICIEEMAKGYNDRYVLNTFVSFFEAINIGTNKDGYVIANGCGMDMIFHTNYTICRILYRLGVLSEKECNTLSNAYINKI